MLSIHCQTVLIRSKEFLDFLCFLSANLRSCELSSFFKLTNLQTCKLANFWIHDSIDRTCESHLSIALVSRTCRSHLSVAPVDRTCQSHLLTALVSHAYLIALVSRAYSNRTFESRFPIMLSIALRAKLILRACECTQVPINVWAYLSVRFKPQEK